jgi:hypothetical protein
MNKTIKIILNILLFALIAGFVYYMFYSMRSEKKTTQSGEESTFISSYEKINSFEAASEIVCFDMYEHAIYAVLADKISVFDLSGEHQWDCAIETGVRDIVVDCRDAACHVPTTIYLLYPTKIALYSLEGRKKGGWQACSDNSDYCAITVTNDYVFVTDAENKNIVQYDKQGNLVRFIKSPEGFIIPSYSFGIISINDTIYISNSGRHKVESYTLDGEFIASFGVAGTQAGAFAGCCNPVYLAKTSDENILTSEKGNPRISSYGKNGKFRSILLDNNLLGGGTDAYRVKVSEENIFIASGKTISVYGMDTSCPPNVKSCGECPMREKCKK